MVATRMSGRSSLVFLVLRAAALPCLMMSIAPEPVVRNDFLPRHVSRPIVPQLAEWATLNHAALMTFWDEGDSWDRHRVAQFLDALRPIGR